MIYCQTGYTRDIPWILHLYTRYIPCEGHSRARFVAHPRLEALDREFLQIFSVFGHREAAHARLRPSKVPQPGVDLINMAAPPRGRASTIGTAALTSVQLLADVLMWNSWGCISVQKAHRYCGSLPQYLWGAKYSGRTAGNAQITYSGCPDQIVIQQRHNCRHAPQWRMDAEG